MFHESFPSAPDGNSLANQTAAKETARLEKKDETEQPHIWALLTPEQRQIAHYAITDLVDKFTDDKGIKIFNRQQFTLLKTEEHNGSRIVVALVKEQGYDPGQDNDAAAGKKRNWNNIMSPKRVPEFTLGVARLEEGRKYFEEDIDTLKGMTLAVYEALIAYARAKGMEPLPDESSPSGVTGERRSWTLLTGEGSGPQLASYAYLQDGQLKVGEIALGVTSPDLRVRPVVEIAFIPTSDSELVKVIMSGVGDDGSA